MHKKLRVHRPQAAGLLRVRNLMFSAFAYKGDSLRAYFNGLGEAVETSRGKKKKQTKKKKTKWEKWEVRRMWKNILCLWKNLCSTRTPA